MRVEQTEPHQTSSLGALLAGKIQSRNLFRAQTQIRENWPSGEASALNLIQNINSSSSHSAKAYTSTYIPSSVEPLHRGDFVGYVWNLRVYPVSRFSVGAKGYKYLSLSSSMVIFSVTHFRQLAAPSLFSNVPPNHLALIPSNFLVLIGLEREKGS
jgi:hypothetical protein